MWGWSWFEAAFACAGLVHDPEALAESGTAEVVFEVGVDPAVTYGVVYDGDAAEFGWIVPVLGEVTSVTDGEVALLEGLRSATSPQVVDTTVEDGGGGCACGGSKGSDRGGSNGTLGVTVEAEGFTGTYSYTVVHAASGAELDAWLAEHGFEGSDPADLEHYVQAEADFVLLLLAPQLGATPAGGRALPPVRIGTAAPTTVFPAVMARHASVDHQRTTVYVLAEDRATVSGWASEDLQGVEGTVGEDPVDLFVQALAPLGEDRTFARTFAGTWNGAFVTRFDLYAPREVHDVDATFALGDGTDPIACTLTLGEGGAAAALLLPAALVAWGRRRHLAHR